MFEQGISVYLGLDEYSKEENYKYLDTAKKYGANYVFSSAHIKESKSNNEDLKALIDYTIKNDMKLSLDVSKPIMEKLLIPEGIFALRLDYGFSDEEIIDMSNNAPYLVELNASTYSICHLEELIKNGLNAKRVRLSYNFYPKLYTGHDIEFVYEKTKTLKALGFSVYAFIRSYNMMRPPMYEGLVTVEKHRNYSLSLQIEELKACELDGIYFGDAYASEKELSILKCHSTDSFILKVNNIQNKKQFSLLNGVYACRRDYNSYLIRTTRVQEEIIKPLNMVDRSKYSLTIDNKDFKRYQGEINICLKDLPKDERVNVLGNVEITPIIIEKIQRGAKFIFSEDE